MPKPIPPVDFDENPEWTPEMLAAARPAGEVHGQAAAALVRKRGRPSLDPAARKLPVTIRLSPDVAEALRATGEGWQTRVDELLRIAMFPGRSTDEVRAPALSMFSIMTRNAGTGQFIRKAGKRSVKKRA